MINLKKQNKRRTKEGLISQIFYNQKGHSKDRGHIQPTYTRKELIEWCFSQPKFHVLYDNWKRLDFQKDYIPSIDRKNDYIGYTMDNIQLMTWMENKLKGERDKIQGINNKNNIAVLQCDMNGYVIAEYHSISEAFRKTKIRHISECCNNKLKSAGGFKWNFKQIQNKKEI